MRCEVTQITNSRVGNYCRAVDDFEYTSKIEGEMTLLASSILSRFYKFCPFKFSIKKRLYFFSKNHWLSMTFYVLHVASLPSFLIVRSRIRIFFFMLEILNCIIFHVGSLMISLSRAQLFIHTKKTNGNSDYGCQVIHPRSMPMSCRAGASPVTSSGSCHDVTDRSTPLPCHLFTPLLLEPASTLPLNRPYDQI